MQTTQRRSETAESPESAPVSRSDAASYAWWKGQSFIPFRYSFSGLLALGVVGAIKCRSAWNTEYWPVALLFTVLFALGTVSLFYDIPRRRLSRVSKAFLGLGIAVLLALMGIGMFHPVWSR